MASLSPGAADGAVEELAAANVDQVDVPEFDEAMYAKDEELWKHRQCVTIMAGATRLEEHGIRISEATLADGRCLQDSPTVKIMSLPDGFAAEERATTNFSPEAWDVVVGSGELFMFLSRGSTGPNTPASVSIMRPGVAKGRSTRSLPEATWTIGGHVQVPCSAVHGVTENDGAFLACITGMVVGIPKEDKPPDAEYPEGWEPRSELVDASVWLMLASKALCCPTQYKNNDGEVIKSVFVVVRRSDSNIAPTSSV